MNLLGHRTMSEGYGDQSLEEHQRELIRIMQIEYTRMKRSLENEQAANVRLCNALVPFANAARDCDMEEALDESSVWESSMIMNVSYGDFRNALNVCRELFPDYDDE